MPIWIDDEIAGGLRYPATRYRDLSMLSTYCQNMSKISIKIDTIEQSVDPPYTSPHQFGKQRIVDVIHLASHLAGA